MRNVKKVDKGTKETREKLTPDPIVTLLKAEKLDLDHINAIDEIDQAFRNLTQASSTIKVHVVERVSPSHQGDFQSVRDIRLERDFQRWANSLTQHDLDIHRALDIIVWRKSPHAVDRERRQRNGLAYQNLLQALDLYCRLRGWKPPVDRKAHG